MSQKQSNRKFLLAVGKACGDPIYTKSGESANPTSEFQHDLQFANVLEVEDTGDMGCCVSVWIDDDGSDPMLEINDTDYIVGRGGEVYFRRRFRLCKPESIAKRVIAILRRLRTTGYWAENKRRGDEFWKLYDAVASHLPSTWQRPDGREENYDHGVYSVGRKKVMITIEGEHQDVWLRGCGRSDVRIRFAGRERSPKRIADKVREILKP